MSSCSVSVIIPVYNVSDYLSHCIDSLLSQTCHDFELVLVDDGSTDGSAEICDAYASKDARIKVVHQANGGVSSARNKGIEMAKGEYVCFVDADDWVEKDMIELLYSAADNKKADFVYCDYIQEKDNDVNYIETARCVENDSRATKMNILNGWFVSSCMSIIRRSILTQHNIRFNEYLRYNEDFNFIAKCLPYFDIINKVEKALYHYNENNLSSAIHKQSNQQGLDEYMSQVEIMDYYNERNILEMYIRPMCSRLVRCIYFYNEKDRVKRYDSFISFKDIISCSYLGIRGQLKVALILYLGWSKFI